MVRIINFFFLFLREINKLRCSDLMDVKHDMRKRRRDKLYDIINVNMQIHPKLSEIN